MEEYFFHDGSSRPLKIRGSFLQWEKGMELNPSLFFGAHHSSYCPMLSHLKTK